MIDIIFSYFKTKKLSFGGSLLLFLSLVSSNCMGQSDTSIIDKTRLIKVSAATGTVYVSTIYVLSNLWYADYKQSKFHRFDDNSEWLQMDKYGHTYSSYLGGFIGKEALESAGFSQRKSILYGGGLGFLFLGTIEIMDGFSADWGFSWGDMASNALGTSLLMGQELLFQKQIIIPKFSYSSSRYRAYNPKLLGENNNQAIIKDYNAQTYWYSVNLYSIYEPIKPKWLNFAFGVGADGMVNSHGNYITNHGEIIRPSRQYYISLDVDFSKINTQNKFLKTLFKAANFIKVPAPTLEFNEEKGSNWHWLFF